MAIDPRAVKFHTLGNKLVEEQKYNEAIVNFDKAIELAPDYAAAFYHRAEAYEYKKLDDQACEDYLKAMALNASYATIHIDSGLDTLLSGPLGKAVAEYKKKTGGSDLHGKKAAAPGTSVHVSGPKEGSPVAMASQPAVKKDKPRGQVGLKPVKVHLRPSDEKVSTEVWSIDSVIAEVLGPKEIPLAQGKVTFKIANKGELDDAYLGPDRGSMTSGKGPKTITLTTDGDGEAKVYFRRSKRVGLNRLEILPEGLPQPVIFDDNTHPAEIHHVEILPKEKHFTTGQKVKFAFTAYDEHDNPIPDLDLAFVLYGKKRHDWEIIDNIGEKTNAQGSYEHEFTMPTLGNIMCRMEAKYKKTDFTAEKQFKVIPGTASSMLFIPKKSTVAPGEKFPLKVRLMDEFDNPIEGLKVKIVPKEAIGGNWKIGAQNSEITGDDGSVSVEVTAPPDSGARAVFGVQTDSIAAEAMIEANFETGQVAIEQSAFSAQASGPDLDLDMDFPTPTATPAPPAAASTPAPAFAPEPLLDIDLGSGDLSGLPEIPDAKNIPAAAPAETSAELMPGGMAGLEALDLDIGGPATPTFATPAPAPPAPPTQGPAVGSSLDQLDSLLTIDAGGGNAFGTPLSAETPAFAAEPLDSLPLPEEPAADSFAPPSEEPLLSMPLDAEPALAEMTFDAPPLDAPAADAPPLADTAPADSFDLPSDDVPVFATPKDNGTAIIITTEEEIITCQAGEVVPVKVKLTGADGRPVSGGVSALFIIEEIPGPAQDSFFMTPSGVQGEKTYEVDPDLSGEALATIQVSSHTGHFNVTVAVQEERTRVTINVAPGSPSTITMTASALKSAPGGTVEIAAKTLDKFGNVVPGEFVQIMTERYAAQPPTLISETTQTDKNGEVKATYQMSATPGDSVSFTANNPNVAPFSIKKVEIQTEGEPASAAPAPPPPKYEAPVQETSFAPTPMPEAPIDSPEGADETDEDVDAYLKSLEADDPYAPPKFNIARGKKPVMEISTMLPKILMYTGIIASVFVLLFAGFSSYKYVVYQYYYTRGINNYNKELFGDAIIAFEKANQMSPTKIEPLQFMAIIYINRAIIAGERGMDRESGKEYSLAMGVLDKALQIDPNNIDVLYYLGEVYEGKHQYCNAIRQYEKILRVEPKYESAESKMILLRPNCKY